MFIYDAKVLQKTSEKGNKQCQNVASVPIKTTIIIIIFIADKSNDKVIKRQSTTPAKSL